MYCIDVRVVSGHSLDSDEVNCLHFDSESVHSHWVDTHRLDSSSGLVGFVKMTGDDGDPLFLRQKEGLYDPLPRFRIPRPVHLNGLSTLLYPRGPYLVMAVDGSFRSGRGGSRPTHEVPLHTFG